MAKFKDKERILKAVREKQLVTHKGVPIRLYLLISQQKHYKQQGVAQNISSNEKQGPAIETTLSNKALI